MENSRRASSRSAVAPFLALEVMTEATRLEAAGRDIAHLEIGQPGDGAPESARAALAAALGQTLGYTTPLGRSDLRERIADWTRRRYGVDVPARRVIVTTGSSTAFQLAFLACFEAGDRLGLGDPSYPSYRAIAQALGLRTERIETLARDRWRVTPDHIAAATRQEPLRGLLVASPANPTGAVLSRREQAELIGAVEAAGAWYISDEIYHGLEFGEPAPSALEVSDDAIIINSFSKNFRMTGWRIGWMIAPERLVPVIEKLAQNLYICPPHASQIAALAAFDADLCLKTARALYRANADRAVAALDALGFTDLAAPGGAFYIYAGLGAHLRAGEDSLSWCRALLAEADVALAPGLDFDPVRGGSAIRLSVAGPAAEVDKGLTRLSAWLRAR